MRKYLQPFLLLLLAAYTFSACEENIEQTEEFPNWKATNAASFQQTLDTAHKAIAQAKAAYGEDWEEHCEWRAFRTFSQGTDTEGKATDSVCAQIIDRGTGSGYPLYTDSVLVNYVGRLLPSPSYPEGRVFDHSSQGSPVEDVFHPDFAQPGRFLVSNTVEGFTTVLQKMRIGDRWKVFIPQELGYGGNAISTIPAYSTLIYDMQLKAYFRAGYSPAL